MLTPEVFVCGELSQSGTNLLRISLNSEIELAFGRFRRGKRFTLPIGDYLYIGSAQNSRGATSLAPRLLRHATRAGGSPHPIRAKLFDHFHEIGLGPHPLLPPLRKTLYWNVDFLLERKEVDLVRVFVIRSPARLEGEIAQRLGTDPCVEIIAPGLGANDTQGGTHLFRIAGEEEWWEMLTKRLTRNYGPRLPLAAE